MFCPYCHGEDTKVVDKRDNSDSGVTRRRRECIGCTKRFTTYERIERVTLNVEKRNGKVVDFDRSKLRNAVVKAMKKRPITDQQVEEMLDDIELKLLNRKKTVVTSTDIGKMVLTRLKKLDKVAYLRFVSVYRDFDTVEKFQKEIKALEE
ncbi:transcriptional repressor NrdR [Candidatus Dojkabacteria bacterium]|uniref:Transcriptional repressor NrdR n=1 Tax=Candidatus Dojkabacteria bacterium TaxID=2099670 RepID=A0A955RK02_9BACT|nr:transcriptional repressor NrdR [Candidatus Dojkabacteria bacterium]